MPSLDDLIKNNVAIWLVGTAVSAFIAGASAYDSILRISNLETIETGELSRLRSEHADFKRKYEAALSKNEEQRHTAGDLLAAESRIDQLKVSLSESRDNLVALQSNTEKVESLLLEKSLEVDRLKSELQRIRAELAIANSRVSTLDDTNTAADQLRADLEEQKALVQAERYKLDRVKQRVRDVLRPKEDHLRDMSRSLERMKGDVGVSREHREQLERIAARLDVIDTLILEIVQ